VLDAYPDWQIPAHVITTVPSADRQKATVRVRIGFDSLAARDAKRGATKPAVADPRILPDMGVKVSFLKEEQAVETAAPVARVTVPKSAVRTVDGRSIVFVVKDDRVERRAIRAGNENSGKVEVLSGLSAGERVVVEGPDTLVDGERIKIQG
jgi:HlyD family secretion protein